MSQVTGTPSRGFDEKAYLAAKQLKPGEDPYRQHAFNQLESDKLSPDRPIRDTRHYRCGEGKAGGRAAPLGFQSRGCKKGGKLPLTQSSY